MKKHLRDKYDQEFNIIGKASIREESGVKVVHAYASRQEDSGIAGSTFDIQRNENVNTYRDNFPWRYYSVVENIRVGEFVSTITNKEVKASTRTLLSMNYTSEVAAPMPTFESFSKTQPANSIVYDINLSSTDHQVTAEDLEKHAAYLYKVWHSLGINAEAVKIQGSYTIGSDTSGNEFNGDTDLICRFDEESMFAIKKPTQLTSCFKTRGSLQ